MIMPAATNNVWNHDRSNDAVNADLLQPDTLLNRMSIACTQPTHPNTDTLMWSTKSKKPSDNPRFIIPAFRWLQSNLHNPYPTKETKVMLSQDSGVSPQSVETWFVNMRQCIGWVTASRQVCKGRHIDTINTAYRIFVHDDPTAYPLTADALNAFHNVKESVERFYTEKLRALGISLAYTIKTAREVQNVAHVSSITSERAGMIALSTSQF